MNKIDGSVTGFCIFLASQGCVRPLMVHTTAASKFFANIFQLGGTKTTDRFDSMDVFLKFTPLEIFYLFLRERMSVNFLKKINTIIRN